MENKAPGGVSDYKSSGVDVEQGDRLVDWIKTQKPTGPHQNVVSGIGGFSALFKLDLKKYPQPILVSCTDGVGTKVRLAVELNRVKPTGVDLVAMCVNDMITCGADPLFFLDYFATSKLNLDQAQEFLAGVLDGLRESNCHLIGGETAEMPGHYKDKDYDCAGFCVGAVNESDVIDGKDLATGDIAVGISSSGFHSNGYSLIRKLFEKDAEKFADLLMTPTRIYVGLVSELKSKMKIKAMAHITGGGITGNIPRVMKVNTSLKVQRWPWPDSFRELQKRSGLSPKEMLETFNCGVGYVIFCDKKDLETVISASAEMGWSSWPIGYVVDRNGPAEVLI